MLKHIYEIGHNLTKTEHNKALTMWIILGIYYLRLYIYTYIYIISIMGSHATSSISYIFVSTVLVGSPGALLQTYIYWY